MGGLFGYDSGVSHVSDCWTTGTLVAKNQIGGVGGGLIKAGSTLVNCYTTMSVSGNFQIGGILGHANLDSNKSNPSEQTTPTNEPDNHIERCLAWNPFIRSVLTDADEHYSSGVIVGYTAIKNYLADCYHKPDIDFVEAPRNAELGYVVTEQANADPGNPLVHGSNNYDFAYHGRTAPATATLTSMARMLGWSDKIWDFSGDVPLLRPKSKDPETGIGGQLPDFPENEFYQ